MNDSKNIHSFPSTLIIFGLAIIAGIGIGYGLNEYFRADNSSKTGNNIVTTTVSTSTQGGSIQGEIVTSTQNNNATAKSFEDCVAQGLPIQESYPRACVVNGIRYTEHIGNVLEKRDLIRVTYPAPNQEISSPLMITGEARGSWFFEGSFPITLTNWDGLIIAEGYATAQGEWMTQDFVPFTATLTFDTPSYGERGSIIFHKDNPSGLPEHDDALEYMIYFLKK